MRADVPYTASDRTFALLARLEADHRDVTLCDSITEIAMRTAYRKFDQEMTRRANASGCVVFREAF